MTILKDLQKMEDIYSGDIKELLTKARLLIESQANQIKAKTIFLNKFYENRFEADKLTIFAGKVKTFGYEEYLLRGKNV
jgi:hypothetical protein